MGSGEGCEICGAVLADKALHEVWHVGLREVEDNVQGLVDASVGEVVDTEPVERPPRLRIFRRRQGRGWSL